MPTLDRDRFAGLEPWLVIPMLLSLGCSGVAPMLLPLEIVKIEGRALHVGVVMASIGAGLLSAPLWSRLADRHRAHRSILVAGGLAIAAALLGFCVAREVHEWGALAFLMGVGAAAAFTIGSLLIGERYPPAEQHGPYGWLQTITTMGTMLGLTLAGVVSHRGLQPAYGFAIASGLSLVAAALGTVLVALPARAAAPATGPSVAGAGPESLGSVTPTLALSEPPLPRSSLLPFWVLLALWMVASMGFNAVGALYPLMMRHEFHVTPHLSSYYLAVATGLSALLFVPASTLSARRGELPVLQGGLGVRTVSLGLLAFMAVTPYLERAWLAFLPYGALVLTWPLLSISSSLLVTRLAGATGGSGIGLFAAGGALAGLLGPVIGGHAADRFGYTSVWLLAATGAGLALLGSLTLVRPVAAARSRVAE